ncbi:MAG: Ig-like domain-containing protein [Armatimonadota bacterium]
MTVGANQQFDATVTGHYNTAVVWSASGGAITQGGLFTPNAAGTYYVTATSVADPDASDTVAVIVQDLAAGSFGISPTQVTMLVNNTQQFIPIYVDLAPGVTWEVVESGGGTIDENGLYTAPNEPGVYHVKGTSTANPELTATAVITVNPVVAVSVAPGAVTLLTGAQQQFEAEVTGTDNTAVTWSTTGGQITQGGLFTAPGTPGTYYVTATSVADPSKSDTVEITVNPVIIVSVAPESVSIYTGAQQQFEAEVTGTSNTAVTWSATGGSVDGNGLYTAPGTPGTYYVTATSVEDNSKSSTAEVVVTLPPVTSIAISPSAVTLEYGAIQQFEAILDNLDPGVTWTVDEGAAGGTITSGGLYTAPNTTGTYHVTVTSVDDPTKSATATISVVPPIRLFITPKTVHLDLGESFQFNGHAQGGTTQLDWSVLEADGGTIDDNGLYTAPMVPGTYHVVVSSVANPKQKDIATVIVDPQ